MPSRASVHWRVAALQALAACGQPADPRCLGWPRVPSIGNCREQLQAKESAQAYLNQDLRRTRRLVKDLRRGSMGMSGLGDPTASMSFMHTPAAGGPGTATPGTGAHMAMTPGGPASTYMTDAGFGGTPYAEEDYDEVSSARPRGLGAEVRMRMCAGMSTGTRHMRRHIYV